MFWGHSEAQLSDESKTTGREAPNWRKASLRMLTYESTTEVKAPARERTDLLTFAPRGILLLPSLLK